MSRRVLVVDDSESTRELLTVILETAGYQVDCAFDGEDAVTLLEGRYVDLVLTDLNMPRLDGIGLIKKLRAMESYKRTPIIMLTTESNATFKDQAKSAGATGWILKPFVADKLLDVVNQVIR
jgi:two-component system, chemotaxis family, chemotaxis protein CheY